MKRILDLFNRERQLTTKNRSTMYNTQWNDRRTDDVRSPNYIFSGWRVAERRLWGFREGDDPLATLFCTRVGQPDATLCDVRLWLCASMYSCSHKDLLGRVP